jgi:uncharacterized membrane protein HdeD (DUF308 family)
LFCWTASATGFLVQISLNTIFNRELLVPIGLVQISTMIVQILLLAYSFKTLMSLQGQQQIMSLREIMTQTSSLLLFAIGDISTLVAINKTLRLHPNNRILAILSLFTINTIFSSVGTALMIRTLSKIC